MVLRFDSSGNLDSNLIVNCSRIKLKTSFLSTIGHHYSYVRLSYKMLINKNIN